MPPLTPADIADAGLVRLGAGIRAPHARPPGPAGAARPAAAAMPRPAAAAMPRPAPPTPAPAIARRPGAGRAHA